MNPTPEQQWSVLSALYEEADALPEHALPGWLAALEARGHPLLPQLRRMLEAREHLDHEDFLDTLPRLGEDEAARIGGWQPGRRIGPYRLVSELGAGGMAEVWLAERNDGRLKRRVALKLPYPRAGHAALALRFERERDILAALRHPHIAALFDADVTPEGQPWLALELVEGEPIGAYCDARRLPVRERVALFRQVLLAVQHAHANLVIHRDLKPANILVTARGEVRLLDFGIAKLLDAGGDSIAETELTRQGGRAMTLRYASPEQVLGQPLGTACDVYALGVVLYELLCGQVPYERADTASRLERAIVEEEPRAPSRRVLLREAAEARGTTPKGLQRVLSPELDAIALRCMAKRVAQRYSSVDALLADVDRWLAGEAVLARAPGAGYRFLKFALRHRLAVGLGSAAIVALAATAAVAVVMGLQAREESARAVAARDFMLGLFQRADQEKSRGADITARELLESGRRDALQRLAGQPRLQAELLSGIGTIQLEMGEHGQADSTFDEVVRIYQSLGAPRERVLAHLARGNNAMRAGNLEAARDSLRLAREVPGRPGADAELEARTSELEGWIAYLQDDAASASEWFRQSRRHAIEVYGRHDRRTLDAMRGLIHSQRQLGHYEEALALLGELEDTVRRGGIDPRELLDSSIDRADLLYELGRYADALRYLSGAYPQCVQVVGPHGQSCRRLLLSQMRVLLRAGWTDRARGLAPQVTPIASDASSPTTQLEARMLLLRMESQTGASAAQRELLQWVATVGASGPDVPINPALKSAALLTAAEACLLTGQPLAADRLVAPLLAPPASASGVAVPPPVMRALAQSLRGIGLLQRGRADEALQWLAAGHGELASILGAGHPLAHLFGLNVALAWQASGRLEEAAAHVGRTVPVVRSAFGADAPTFLRLERLQRELARARATAPAASGAPASAVEFFS